MTSILKGEPIAKNGNLFNTLNTEDQLKSQSSPQRFLDINSFLTQPLLSSAPNEIKPIIKVIESEVPSDARDISQTAVGTLTGCKSSEVSIVSLEDFLCSLNTKRLLVLPSEDIVDKYFFSLMGRKKQINDLIDEWVETKILRKVCQGYDEKKETRMKALLCTISARIGHPNAFLLLCRCYQLVLTVKDEFSSVSSTAQHLQNWALLLKNLLKELTLKKPALLLLDLDVLKFNIMQVRPSFKDQLQEKKNLQQHWQQISRIVRLTLASGIALFVAYGFHTAQKKNRLFQFMQIEDSKKIESPICPPQCRLSFFPTDISILRKESVHKSFINTMLQNSSNVCERPFVPSKDQEVLPKSHIVANEREITTHKKESDTATSPSSLWMLAAGGVALITALASSLLCTQRKDSVTQISSVGVNRTFEPVIIVHSHKVQAQIVSPANELSTISNSFSQEQQNSSLQPYTDQNNLTNSFDLSEASPSKELETIKHSKDQKLTSNNKNVMQRAIEQADAEQKNLLAIETHKQTNKDLIENLEKMTTCIAQLNVDEVPTLEKLFLLIERSHEQTLHCKPMDSIPIQKMIVNLTKEIISALYESIHVPKGKKVSAQLATFLADWTISTSHHNEDDATLKKIITNAKMINEGKVTSEYSDSWDVFYDIKKNFQSIVYYALKARHTCQDFVAFSASCSRDEFSRKLKECVHLKLNVYNLLRFLENFSILLQNRLGAQSGV